MPPTDRCWPSMRTSGASISRFRPCPSSSPGRLVATEDKNFYEHNGLDFQGITRAGVFFPQNYGSGRRPRAPPPSPSRFKNFLLTNETTFSRKIEALLALKIERIAFEAEDSRASSQRDLSGHGALRVAAASLLYFDKSARAHHSGSRLSWPRCSRVPTITIRSAVTMRRSPAAITSSTAWPRSTTSRRRRPSRPRSILKVTTWPTGARIFAH